MQISNHYQTWPINRDWGNIWTKLFPNIWPFSAGCKWCCIIFWWPNGASPLNSIARPYDERAFSPLDFTVVWHLHLYIHWLLPLIVNGKSFKSQHCSRLHKYVNGFFSSENIYVSFIGAKAKTRVTGSLGRNWARLAVMDGPVPFDPPDKHALAHAGMIKELLDMRDGINECLHLSRTEIDDLIYHLCCEWQVVFIVVVVFYSE